MKLFKLESWPTWTIASVIVVLVVLLATWMVIGIPDCPVCGQKEYSYRIVGYMPVTTMIGKTTTVTLQPIYGTTSHICPGKR